MAIARSFYTRHSALIEIKLILCPPMGGILVRTNGEILAFLGKDRITRKSTQSGDSVVRILLHNQTHFGSDQRVTGLLRP